MATQLKAVPVALPDAPKVYAAIAAVQGELAKVGIAKNRKNSQGSGYNFRGIDDVYAALAPLLSSHGLCVIPRLTERTVAERSSKNGGALFYVTVKSDFDFVAVEDGSVHTCSTYGEAMDSGDKATNKAMSAAYKYAAFMTFAIPVEGEQDADEVTHEVARREPAPRTVLDGPYKSKSAIQAGLHRFQTAFLAAPDLAALEVIMEQAAPLIEQAKRDDPDYWAGVGPDDIGFEARIQAKRDSLPSGAYGALVASMEGCKTKAELSDWTREHGDTIEGLPDSETRRFNTAYDTLAAALQANATPNVTDAG